jgi:hypothetical protein
VANTSTGGAIYSPRRAGEAHRSCLDGSRAVAELGLTAPVPPGDGLRSTVERMRAR